MISKRIIIPVVLTAVLGGAIIGTSRIQAFNANPFSDLAQMISAKFNLDENKVQEVVSQYQTEKRVENQKEMKNREEANLSQLVSEGKITEAQKQAIIKKHEELRNKYQPNGMQGKTSEERGAIIEQRKAEIEAWAKSQGIDLSSVSLGVGGGMGKGMGQGRGMGR